MIVVKWHNTVSNANAFFIMFSWISEPFIGDNVNTSRNLPIIIKIFLQTKLNAKWWPDANWWLCNTSPSTMILPSIALRGLPRSLLASALRRSSSSYYRSDVLSRTEVVSCPRRASELTSGLIRAGMPIAVDLGRSFKKRHKLYFIQSFNFIKTSFYSSSKTRSRSKFNYYILFYHLCS